MHARRFLSAPEVQSGWAHAAAPEEASQQQQHEEEGLSVRGGSNDSSIGEGGRAGSVGPHGDIEAPGRPSIAGSEASNAVAIGEPPPPLTCLSPSGSRLYPSLAPSQTEQLAALSS